MIGFAPSGGAPTQGAGTDEEREAMLKAYGVLIVYLGRTGMGDEMGEFPMLNGTDDMTCDEIQGWWNKLEAWYDGMDYGEVLALQPKIIDDRFAEETSERG